MFTGNNQNVKRIEIRYVLKLTGTGPIGDIQNKYNRGVYLGKFTVCNSTRV